MALSVNGGGGGWHGGGRRRYGGSGSLSEINVTPFVDVVLVLLIIFMLTAHVMEFGIEVEVPKVNNYKDTAKELPVVNLTKDGTLYLNDKPININVLPDEIIRRFGQGKSVYLRADRETTWEPIAQIMDKLGQAKIGINCVTQPQDSADKARK